MLRSVILLELVFAYAVVRIGSLFFPTEIHLFQVLCAKELISLIELPWHLCWKSVVLSVWVCFWTLKMFVLHCHAYLHTLLSLWKEVRTLTSLDFMIIFLAVLGHFPIHIHFKLISQFHSNKSFSIPLRTVSVYPIWIIAILLTLLLLLVFWLQGWYGSLKGFA